MCTKFPRYTFARYRSPSRVDQQFVLSSPPCPREEEGDKQRLLSFLFLPLLLLCAFPFPLPVNRAQLLMYRAISDTVLLIRENCRTAYNICPLLRLLRVRLYVLCNPCVNRAINLQAFGHAEQKSSQQLVK